jgi:hypothetical protein
MDDQEQVNPGLIDDLHRRKVLRSTTIYAAIGWCVLQWSDLLFKSLGWPDWTTTLMLTAVVLGFPVAVTLSWAFDITPGGVVRSDTSQVPVARRTRATYIVDAVVVSALLVTVALLVLDA